MTEATATRRGAHHVLQVVYYASQLIPVALLLVFLVGSLALSGAQVVPDGHEAWDAVLPFPLFIVPGWLSIALAVIGAGVVIPFVATTRPVQAPDLLAAFAYSIGAALANFYFSFAFLGTHWIACVIAGVCILVLIVRMLMIVPSYERMRKAGELPNGFR